MVDELHDVCNSQPGLHLNFGKSPALVNLTVSHCEGAAVYMVVAELLTVYRA